MENENEDFFNTDWTSIPEKEKSEIISRHVEFVDVSRRAVGASGSYVANMRSLMLMMTVTLVCLIRSSENRTIVLSIIGFQFIKTIFSRFFEVSLRSSVDVARKNLVEIVMKKLGERR